MPYFASLSSLPGIDTACEQVHRAMHTCDHDRAWANRINALSKACPSSQHETRYH